MDSIWFNKTQKLSDISEWGKDNLAAHLGMEFCEMGPDFLQAKMPVDHRTRQPYGLLHGGASLALAETLGGFASALVVDHNAFMCVGLEINANHIKSTRDGFVYGTCHPVHLGRSTHVWDIRIHDENGKLLCISRLTVAIISRGIDGV